MEIRPVGTELFNADPRTWRRQEMLLYFTNPPYNDGQFEVQCTSLELWYSQYTDPQTRVAGSTRRAANETTFERCQSFILWSRQTTAISSDGCYEQTNWAADKM